MPDWKVHLSFAIVLLFITLKLFYSFGMVLNSYKIALIIFFSMFSSVFPDMDRANSKIRRATSLLLSLAFVLTLLYFKVLSKWYELPLLFLFVYLLLRFFPTPHRSVLHTNRFSIVFTLFVALLFFLLGFNIREVLFSSIVIFISYLSHLLLDGVG